jgi:diaminohydroxyphosphoribosylaminopyrimidine deaminase / 5-amino-6-(5-phosphoribosylamino)uracil reductase
VTESDLLFLDAAIELARNGLYSTTPNPRVGCVLVRDGCVIGRGWHHRAGGPHAEVEALMDAARLAPDQSIEGATCYVSLEPCAHHGKTAPCADALIAARIGRVVIASHDPDPRVAGMGIARMRAAGMVVEIAERAAALELNKGFFRRFTRQRPWVRVKVAASLDGRTAMASGESRWITGAEARADVQYWRARSCAIVTGVGTVLADDPQLNVRDSAYAVDGAIRQPLRVVVDSSLRTPPNARVLQARDKALVAAVAGHTAQPLVDAGVEVFETSGPRVDLAALLDALAARGANEVLVEAGATVTGEVLRQALWDEAIVYLAPKLLGRDARPFAELSVERLADSIDGTIADVRLVGGDLRLQILRIAA